MTELRRVDSSTHNEEVRNFDSESLTVVEIAAAERINALKKQIPSEVTPRTPLRDRAFTIDTSGVSTKIELDTLFKSAIQNAESETHVNALMHQYTDLSAQFDTEVVVSVTDPHLGADIDQVDIVDIPRGHKPVEGSVRRQIGLAGPSRKAEVEEKQQERLNAGLQELTKFLGTDDPLDVFTGKSEDGTPRIHTMTIYRPILDSEGEPTGQHNQVYYNLTHDSELVRLFKDEGLSHEQAEAKVSGENLDKFRAIEKELDEISQEIAPRSSGGPNYTSSSIGNVNGAHPFAQMGSQASKIFGDDYFIKNKFSKLIADPKYYMVHPNGVLNNYGRRTLKEIGAAFGLIEGEKNRLKNLIIQKRNQCNNLKQHPDRNPLESRSEIAAIEREIQELQGKLNELNEASTPHTKFAAAWLIMKLNAPVTLSKDGVSQQVNIRQALQMDASKYDSMKTSDGKMIPVDPVKLRERLSFETSREFDTYVQKENDGWFSSAKLSDEDRIPGFAIGRAFFYGGLNGGKQDPQFRIINELRHEDHSVTLQREIPGLSWVIPTAQEVVRAVEAGEVSQGSSQKISKTTQDDVLGTIKGIKGLATQGLKPAEAILELQKTGLVADDRWSITKWWAGG